MWRNRSFIGGAFVLASIMPVGAEPTFDPATTFSMLVANVRPVAYRIDLFPNVAKLAAAGAKEDIEFRGKEEIDLQVLRSTSVLTLNSLGLEFDGADIVGNDGGAAGDNEAKISVDKAAQTVTFRFKHLLPPGLHTLKVAYSGKITEAAEGMYYSDYDTPTGKRRMLITQFEPTDARRLFPGWDEPALKATFTLSAVLPSAYVAVSNTPAQKQPAGPGRMKWTFEKTPNMSSYLLVLVAGDLEHIPEKIAGVDVAVYASKGRKEEGAYALDVMRKVLPYYNDYFGLSYPLPKLDLIAIPNFEATAMENWGGITYIDNSVLYDEKESTQSTRELIYIVVAHEMAHQWSGDLVTMAWWDDLWLNEGFARWMEKKAPDHFNPEWKLWDRFHEDKEAAMIPDARPTAKAVRREIVDDSQIISAFDSITYSKGASIIRMIESYVGADKFREGMRRYMIARAYSNATGADLWAEVEKAAGSKNGEIAGIADGFVNKPGVPLIRVAVSCTNGKTAATLTRERFTVHDPAPKKPVWLVPVTLGMVGDPTPKRLLVGDDAAKVEFDGCDRPVKANHGDVGYYRVQYDDGALKQLIASFLQLGPADRVNLLADTWALVEAGRAGAPAFLELTKQLPQETELSVWTRAIAALREIDDLERGAPGRESFRAYARRLIRPVLERLGWDPKPDEEKTAPLTPELRALAIVTLGRFGDEAVIAIVRQRVEALRQNASMVHKELREPVAIVTGYGSERATFDQLRELGRSATTTELKLRYYYALAGAGTPDLIKDIVGIALTDEVQSGRVSKFLAKAAAESGNPDVVWKQVFERRADILKKLSGGDKQKLLPLVGRASSNPEIATELKRIIADSATSEGARYEAEKAVDQIEFSIEFKQRLLPAVDGWIKANGGG
jgi:aminopeptidase N